MTKRLPEQLFATPYSSGGLTDGGVEPRGASDEFDVALNGFQKRAVRGLMKKSGADQNFRETINAIGGGRFSSEELGVLEERVLDAAGWDDVGRLYGIQAGSPVVLSPSQKVTIDGLVDQLGSDALARRVQGAYRDALRNGQVVVH